MAEEKEKIVVKSKSKKVLFIIWIIVIILAGLYYKMYQNSKVINTINITKKTKINKVQDKMESIKLYLPNENMRGLKTIEKEIPIVYKKRDKIDTVANVYFDELKDMNLLKGDNIDITNIYLVDGIVYLDCNEDLKELNVPNRTNILILYGLVDSLSQIKGIKGVKFLISHKEIKGNFSKIYTRDIDI